MRCQLPVRPAFTRKLTELPEPIQDPPLRLKAPPPLLLLPPKLLLLLPLA